MTPRDSVAEDNVRKQYEVKTERYPLVSWDLFCESLKLYLFYPIFSRISHQNRLKLECNRFQLVVNLFWMLNLWITCVIIQKSTIKARNCLWSKSSNVGFMTPRYNDIEKCAETGWTVFSLGQGCGVRGRTPIIYFSTFRRFRRPRTDAIDMIRRISSICFINSEEKTKLLPFLEDLTVLSYFLFF